MRTQDLAAALRARGARLAASASKRLGDALIAAAADELPGITATAEDDGVVLSGRGLRARAFGTRRAAADPRLQGLVLRAREMRR